MLIAQTSPTDFDVFRAWDQRNRTRFTGHGQPWPSAAAYAYAGYAADPIGGNWSVVVNATASPEEWTQRVQPGDLLRGTFRRSVDRSTTPATCSS